MAGPLGRIGRQVNCRSDAVDRCFRFTGAALLTVRRAFVI
ncbi:hypothetical protein C725_1403 [Pacificimonas flava]|uniref:Uncharacterized protein n=1 Tax=Pacificimonas flava TaxID=1234595 RepID=M2U654_9SPHN|nr:hypothetical protein C725_1403 [Pacificimonas flava]